MTALAPVAETLVLTRREVGRLLSLPECIAIRITCGASAFWLS